MISPRKFHRSLLNESHPNMMILSHLEMSYSLTKTNLIKRISMSQRRKILPKIFAKIFPKMTLLKRPNRKILKRISSRCQPQKWERRRRQILAIIFAKIFPRIWVRLHRMMLSMWSHRQPQRLRTWCQSHKIWLLIPTCKEILLRRRKILLKSPRELWLIWWLSRQSNDRHIDLLLSYLLSMRTRKISLIHPSSVPKRSARDMAIQSRKSKRIFVKLKKSTSIGWGDTNS